MKCFKVLLAVACLSCDVPTGGAAASGSYQGFERVDIACHNGWETPRGWFDGVSLAVAHPGEVRACAVRYGGVTMVCWEVKRCDPAHE